MTPLRIFSRRMSASSLRLKLEAWKGSPKSLFDRGLGVLSTKLGTRIVPTWSKISYLREVADVLRMLHTTAAVTVASGAP